MKRGAIFLTVLTLMLILSTGVHSFATDAKVGFFNIGTAGGVTITAKDSSGVVIASVEDVDKDGTDDTFYRGSDRLEVTYSKATSGNQYDVYLVEGNSLDVLKSDFTKVYYVDQLVATGSNVVFNVMPKIPSHTMDMTLFISRDDGNDRVSVPLSYLVDMAHQHPLTKVESVMADCENDGNNEYWACSVCDKYYSDEDGLSEIPENSWVIPALGHDYEITYKWSADNSSVIATAVCGRDESHTVTQTVDVEISTTPATCAATGEQTYTAAFTEGPFTTQVKTEQIAKLDHTYTEPQWYWDETLATVSAGFPCSKCDHIEMVSGDVLDRTVVTGVHEMPGYITATGRVIFQGKVYFDPKEIETAAPGHVYGPPLWEWAGDGSSAYLVATCTACDDSIRVTATVTPSGKKVEPTCTETGQAKFIATAEYNGEWLTDIHTITIPALRHDWNKPEWIWAEDCSTATAVFTCTRDETHIVEVKASIEDGSILTDDSIIAKKYEDVQKPYTAKIVGPDDIIYEDSVSKTLKATHKVRDTKKSKDDKSVTIGVETDTLKAEVKGNVSVTAPAIIASYDEGGRFLGLEVITREKEAIEPSEEAESIKILWIEANGYKPMVDAEEVRRH